MKNFLALLLGLLLCFFITEVFLMVADPFKFRVKGDRIVLPANQVYRFHNSQFPGLDPDIVHTKNSLGFRGEEPPEHFSQRLRMITVGGSTTECFYLSDGKTWPDLLAEALRKRHPDLWMNNAGLDGHSTHGHLILLSDHLVKLKPKVVFFLTGANDMERHDLEKFEGRPDGVRSPKEILKNIIQKSEVVCMLINFYRVYRSERSGVAHHGFDFRHAAVLELSDEAIQEYLDKRQAPYLSGYRERLRALIRISRENAIEPVLITQPTLCGIGVDVYAGINIETVKINETQNGKLCFFAYELYNDVQRELGRSEGVLVIDLAAKLPKDTRYYYDELHFSNEGAREAARLIAADFLLPVT